MNGSNVAGRVVHRLTGPRSGRGEVWVVSVLIASATFMVGVGAISSLRPSSDENTAARFLAHGADFRRLVVMVLSDGRRLTSVREPVSLSELVAAGANGDAYRSLLVTIGVTDLLYFPRSGRIVLPISAAGGGFAGTSQSYVYTGKAAANLLPGSQRSSLRGPGVPPMSTDSDLEGGWFVHREGVVRGLPAPF